MFHAVVEEDSIAHRLFADLHALADMVRSNITILLLVLSSICARVFCADVVPNLRASWGIFVLPNNEGG